MYIVFKYLITASLIVLISEVAKRSDQFGAILAALPTMTVLTLIWLYVEKQPAEKIANHAYYTFWYVIPTLPMFLWFPWLLKKLGFVWALFASLLLTGFCFVILAWILKKFGVIL